MSDLISRSELINKIRGIVPGSQDVDFIVRLIENQPTTYNIDKVVEELKENASRYTKKYLTPYGNNGYRDIKAISIRKAIEIVKQGGVADDVCEWKYNDTEYYWESSCDHLHIFMSDGPKENEYDFCPYCGKKIKAGGAYDD